MLDHVSISVSDMAGATAFYDAVMDVLGYPCVRREADALGYGVRSTADDDNRTYISVLLDPDTAPSQLRHWCFRATHRSAVDAFHAAGLAHGGVDEGAPGLRPAYHPDYYAAFLADPDGNRIEAVCHRRPKPQMDADTDNAEGARIALRRMTNADLSAVLAIEVHANQSDFVDPIADVLQAHTGFWDDHVVVADNNIIGFFQIDATTDDVRIPGQIEFHEVRIDHRYQGRGYGSAFLEALRDYLKSTYPQAKAVCLSVNFRNPGAYKVYERGGFRDTGDVYHGGGAGPQHVMSMSLTE